MKKHDFCIPNTNTIARPYAEVIGSTGGGAGRFLYEDTGITCPPNKPINISVPNAGNTGNLFINWTGNTSNFSGNTGGSNINSNFNIPNMSMPNNIPSISNPSSADHQVIARYQNLTKGFTGQILGGAVHDERHKRDYSEKPQVNMEMLSAVRKIDREDNAKAVNFILFHGHYLNDDDMYWLTSMFNTHKGNLAVNIVDLSNNCLRLAANKDMPFFSFNYPFYTPWHVVRLDLSNNNIGDDGAICIANGLAKGFFPITKKIDLSGNNITKEGDTKLVQALKGLWQDFAIFTHTLDEIVKMDEGTKEEKVAIYKAIVEKGKAIGAYNTAMVVDKSWWGKISHGLKELEFKGKWLFGFGKCHIVPDPKEVATSYGQDKIIATLPEKTASGLKIAKKGTNVLTKHYDFVTCFVSSTDKIWASELGQEIAKYELCLLGENDFCGGE